MANYSDTSISFNGELAPEALQYVKTFIKDNYLNLDTLKSDYSSMEIFSIDDTETSFVISGSGRWHAPHGFFEMLAAKYKLSGHYLDRECGCDFTHLMEFEEGHKVLDVEEDYFSQLAFDWCDIDELVEDRSFIVEEEDWESEYANDIALFAKNGITLEDLKERWRVENEE